MRTLRFYGQDQASRATWGKVIAGRIKFNAGAMRGREYSPHVFSGETGRLPDEYTQELRDGAPDYIVFSYETPIMWHDAETGKWRFPRVTYSPTTSRHQGHAEYAIKVWDGERWNTPDCFDDSGPRLEVPSGHSLNYAAESDTELDSAADQAVMQRARQSLYAGDLAIVAYDAIGLPVLAGDRR